MNEFNCTLLQLWVKGKEDLVRQPWLGNQSGRMKTEFKPVKLNLKIDLVSSYHFGGVGKYIPYHLNL